MKRFRTTLLTVCLLALGCSRTAEHYVKKGVDAYSAGKYTDASVEFRKALQQDPNNGEAYYRLGLSELGLRKANQAVDAFTRAAEILPQRLDVQNQLAQLLLIAYMGNPERPESLYKRLANLAVQMTTIDPESVDGLRLKGILAMVDKRPEESVEYLRRAVRNKPGDPAGVLLLAQALLQAGKAGEAESLARDLTAKNSAFEGGYDFLSRILVASKREGEADVLMEQAAAANPNDANFQLRLARHLYSRGKREAALAVAARLKNGKVFPTGFLQAGEFLRKQGELPEALKIYEECAAAGGTPEGECRRRMAEIYLAQGRRDEALQIAAQLAGAKRPDDEAVLLHSRLLLEKGESEKGLAGLRQLAEKNPDSARDQFNLGQAYVATGDAAAAEGPLKQAIHLSPVYLEPRIALAGLEEGRNKTQEVLRIANEVLTIEPGEWRAQLLRARALTRLGQYEEARAGLPPVKESDPRHADIELQRAAIDAAQGRAKSAEEGLRKLVQRYPDDLRPLESLAGLFVAQNQPGKALAVVQTEKSRRQESAGFHALLARTALRAGNSALAFDEYRVAVQRTPVAPLLLELAQALSANGAHAEAITLAERARRLGQSPPEVEAAAGFIYEAAGNRVEAEAAYRRALAVRSIPPVMNNMAYLLADQGKPEEALPLIEKARQLEPRNPAFQDTYAYVQFKQNQVESAASLWGDLVKSYPKHPGFRYHYALAMAKKGEKEQARSELQLALSNQPTVGDEQKIRALMASLSPAN